MSQPPNTGPRPCHPLEAVARAMSLVGVKSGCYVLGTGDFLGEGHPPWTTRDGLTGSDCAGFAISWCYKLPRHRPGYNRGAWATVADDINCNSVLEDAAHAQELFVLATGRPQIGDLLCYPTFTVFADGAPHKFIGHVAIVVSLDRCGEWDPAHPTYEALDVAQCKGPNGRAPAVIKTDGSIWAQHDATWPKPQHRTVMLRART